MKIINIAHIVKQKQESKIIEVSKEKSKIIELPVKESSEKFIEPFVRSYPVSKVKVKKKISDDDIFKDLDDRSTWLNWFVIVYPDNHQEWTRNSTKKNLEIYLQRLEIDYKAVHKAEFNKDTLETKIYD